MLELYLESEVCMLPFAVVLSLALAPWLGPATQPACTQISDPSTTDLAGVVAFSSRDALAVGVAFPDDVTAAQTWRGAGWSSVATPPIQGAVASFFLGITKIPGTRQAWAVGYSLSGSQGLYDQLLAEFWDGQRWSLNSPADAGDLYAVSAWSKQSVFAVGESAGTPLAGHWDGHAWQETALPLPTVGQPLGKASSVVATGPNSAFAVGQAGNSLAIWRFANGVWALTPGTVSGLNIWGVNLNNLTLVPGSSAIWAVGQRQLRNGDSLPISLYFNGSTWFVVPTPAPPNPGFNSLDAVVALDRTHVLASGDFHGRFGRGFYERWDGMRWQLDNARIDGGIVNALAVIPGMRQAWAVGYHYPDAITERCPI